MMKNYKILFVLLISFVMVGCASGEIEATKKDFPTISGVDMDGNIVSNEIFNGYDATVVNFWSNSCGTCIEEMPELEAYYQEFKEKNINMIGIGTDSGQNTDKLSFAKKILRDKGVTYLNISPDVNGDFYNKFINDLTGYPMTFIVDGEGVIIGEPIVGVVKNQEEKLKKRLEEIINK